MSAPRVVCLVGPTASGKTTLALELARGARRGDRLGRLATDLPADGHRHGEADAGRAAAGAAPLPGPGRPRRDASTPPGSVRAATHALDDVRARGRHALVVGGTGLWLRVLLRGLCPAPPRAPAVRAALRALAAQRGPDELHRHLAVLDPPAAARIHPRDAVRVERALEVVFASGRRLSDWQAAHRFAESSYDALLVGLAVATPDARRAHRGARAPDGRGRIRRRGPAPAGERTRRYGAGVGQRRLSRDARARRRRAAISRPRSGPSCVSTRRFAKRQRTWFRAEPGVRVARSGAGPRAGAVGSDDVPRARGASGGVSGAARVAKPQAPR